MATYHPKKQLWEARRRIKFADGTTSRKSFWAPTENEAEEAANLFINLYQPRTDGLTFEYFATFHYAPSIQARSENWRSQVVWATKNHLFPRWGHLQLKMILRPEVMTWFAMLEAEGKLSAHSISHLRKVFHAIMELATYDEHVTRNPVYKILLSPSTHKPTVWTLRQLARLVLCSKGLVWQPVWFLGGFLGLRVGESIGLASNDISSGHVDIHHQVLKSKNRIERVSRVKTPSSVRTIPIPPEVYRRLQSMCSTENTLACTGEKGNLLDPENASRGLRNAIEKANGSITQEDIDAGLMPLIPGTAHDLRHTCKSILTDLHCPEMAIRQIMGHAGKDAHDRYGWAFDSTIKEHLGTMMQALDEEERLLALRPDPGVNAKGEAEKSSHI